VKYKLQYFDSDGDVCEAEFNSIHELNFFVNSIGKKRIIDLQGEGIVPPSLDEETFLLSIHFPPNKVN
jgi:hypothetical protein